MYLFEVLSLTIFRNTGKILIIYASLLGYVLNLLYVSISFRYVVFIPISKTRRLLMHIL